MLDFLTLLINNIWILTAVIIAICLIVLGLARKTLGTVAKIIIIVIAGLFIAVAIGLTTFPEIKDTIIDAITNYSGFVQDTYTGEQFIK